MTPERLEKLRRIVSMDDGPNNVEAELLAEVDRLREALRVIVSGKISEDNNHPLGPYASMAFRFLKIARAVLSSGGAP